MWRSSCRSSPAGRVYTFPRLEGSSPNGPQDCHWTSFNFWNIIPSDAFSQADNVGREIRTAYHPIDKPQRLGDIVFLLNEKGDGIHSAVFVADDIVFTKNGSNMARRGSSCGWRICRRTTRPTGR